MSTGATATRPSMRVTVNGPATCARFTTYRESRPQRNDLAIPGNHSEWAALRSNLEIRLAGAQSDLASLIVVLHDHAAVGVELYSGAVIQTQRPLFADRRRDFPAPGEAEDAKKCHTYYESGQRREPAV